MNVTTVPGERGSLKKAATPTLKSINAVDPSAELLRHLRTLGRLNPDTQTVSHAIEQLFGSDSEAAMELARADHLYPAIMIELVSEFVDEAHRVIRTKSRRSARRLIAMLFEGTKADLQVWFADARLKPPPRDAVEAAIDKARALVERYTRAYSAPADVSADDGPLDEAKAIIWRARCEMINWFREPESTDEGADRRAIIECVVAENHPRGNAAIFDALCALVGGLEDEGSYGSDLEAAIDFWFDKMEEDRCAKIAADNSGLYARALRYRRNDYS